MRRIVISAIIIVVVVIGAFSYVALTNGRSSANLPVNEDPDDQGDDNTNGDQTKEPTLFDTSLITSPRYMAGSDAKLFLTLTYAGQGQEGTYNYTWGKEYTFQLTVASASELNRTVFAKIFAEKDGGIGASCLLLRINGSEAALTMTTVGDTTVLDGDLGSWKSDQLEYVLPFGVIFNRTGDFNLTVQCFDAYTGAPLSLPVSAVPLHVPVAGSIQVKAMGPGEYRVVENVTYFAVLVNVTNGWNVRHSFNATDLVLMNGSVAVAPNTTAMNFLEQSLAIGQSAQYLALYEVTGDPSSFSLAYNDRASGKTVVIPMG